MNKGPALSAALLILLNAGTAFAQISAESILARTKILASDSFEGRAPGSPGEEKTVAYLSS